jgi:hypothetical protein
LKENHFLFAMSLDPKDDTDKAFSAAFLGLTNVLQLLFSPASSSVSDVY